MIEGGVFEHTASHQAYDGDDFISSLLLFSCSSIKLAPLFEDLTALSSASDQRTHFRALSTNK